MTKFENYCALSLSCKFSSHISILKALRGPKIKKKKKTTKQTYLPFNYMTVFNSEFPKSIWPQSPFICISSKSLLNECFTEQVLGSTRLAGK